MASRTNFSMPANSVGGLVETTADRLGSIGIDIDKDGIGFDVRNTS